MTLSTGYFDDTGIWRQTTQANKSIAINSAIIAAGTPLAAFANGASTTPGVTLDNSEIVGIRWNNDAAPAAFYVEFDLPTDRQPNTPLIVHLLAAKSGATSGDATTFTVGAFLKPSGTLQDADSDAGGASSAMVGTATAKTIQHVTRTIAATDVPNATAAIPATVMLSVKPTAGLLGTDDVTLNSLYVEFTKVVHPN